MSLDDFYPPAKCHKLAHDVEVPARGMGDHGHDRRFSADLVKVEANFVRQPHQLDCTRIAYNLQYHLTLGE